VLGSSRGDSIHNYRHREFVVCDSLFHQNRLETPPASKVLGQDKYVAETLLHDVFLLLARGETGKEHLCKTLATLEKEACVHIRLS